MDIDIRGPRPETLDLELGQRLVTLETGRIARQADASILVRESENTVLVTVVAASEPRAGADFFPLTVEYREKMAAAGRIPGSFQRREGRISDREVLVSRLIDRSLRPLFPRGFRNEVQVQATVLSAQESGDPASLALLGAGAALTLSEIPFEGPVLGCRSVLRNGTSILLPVAGEREDALADLILSLGPRGLVMVEGEASEVPDEEMLDHLWNSIEGLEAPREALADWAARAGKRKKPFAIPSHPEDWVSRLEEHCLPALRKALSESGKAARREAVERILRDYLDRRLNEGADEAECAVIPELFHDLQKRLVRGRILEEGRRLDGRTTEEIRPIWGQTGWLPGAHGSAIFTRGETQALVTCTLGSSRDRQRIDGLHGLHEERFLLHYNFPPYSVGEIRPLRGPGRREIGHGNLARRALEPVLPPFEEFPYAIRVESDISESNGSSSMATVCGGCMALLDAGVPLRNRVAGIAMGLVEENGKVAILSDILGDEDHLGDMDFKMTGTRRGITALQMDNKIGGLTREILAEAISKARNGLRHILGRIAEIQPEGRSEVADHAPRIHKLRIQPHLIGSLIGPRGANIQRIQQETGAKIEIEDSGLLTVFCEDGDSWRKVKEEIRRATGEVDVGETFDGVVTGVKEFGVFVKLFGSTEGLVPAGSLKSSRPAKGDGLRVRVEGVDGKGRIRLSPV